MIEALTGHTTYAQAGNDPAAKVVGHVAKLTGSASLVRNGVTVVLNNGDAVYQNDVVQTGSGSALGLVLSDGTTFNLTANARLMLNDLTYDATSTSNTSLFTLVQGAASFVAGQVAKTGDMKVATPVAAIGIRGTAVILDISTTDGKVSISVVDQQDGAVHAVQVFNTRGDLIGTVTSNGSTLTLTPTATFDVIAQQSDKSPAQVAQEFRTFQAVLNTYDIQKAIDPNLPQHTDNSGSGDKNSNPQQTKYANLGSTPANPVVTDSRPLTGTSAVGTDPVLVTATPVVITVQSSGATGTVSSQTPADPVIVLAAASVPFVVTPSSVTKVSSGSGDHFGPVMSADGQFVTYDPDGAIYLFDRSSGVTSTIEAPAGGFTFSSPTISSDGRFIVYQRSDGLVVVYNNDSSDPANYQQKTQIASGTSPAISGDGSRILLENGGNIIVYDQQGRVLTTITPAEVAGAGALWKPAVSADGHVITFWSSDSVGAGGAGHLYSYDLSTGILAAIADTAANAGISAASISADGHYVVYQSIISGGHSEIYLYDLNAGKVVFATSNAAGGSYNPAISPDGHFIIFASDARLTADDTNSVADTYVVDVSNPSAPVFKLVSALADGTQGNAASNLGASISAGGLFVAFGSNASNFSSTDGPGGNIFIVDPSSGRSAIIQETAGSPSTLTASGTILLTGDHTGTTISSSGDPARFSALFDANGNIVWTFSEAKSDFVALAYGQDASQQFVITLTSGTTTTNIPITVTVHDAVQPAVPVVAVPGSIVGDNLDNTLTGTAGNDIFQGFGGNDTIIGLTGVDRAVYADATGGIAVDLAAGTVSGPGVGIDTLIGIEAIQGSNFADHYSAAGFTGNAGVPGVPAGFNSFEGMGGDDVIIGNVNVQGQALTRVSYLSATAAVTVDFAAGTGIGNASVGTDHFTNVNAVIGSSFGDTLLGSDNPAGTYEQFDGRAGNDFIDGRGGYDFVTYNNDPATTSGIVVNMAAGIVTGDASIGTDTLRHVEGVRGTNFADTYDATGFSGSSTNAGSLGTFNSFDGQGGDDTIIGNGNTRIQYSNSTAAVNVDFVLGTATGDASVGTDHFTGVNAVMGSMFDDTLKGSGNNETFMGLAGNDFIDGRGGFDIAQYNNMTYTTGPISVDLVDGIVTGDASNGVDTLRSIEGIQGTNFADTFDATNFGTAGYLNTAVYNVGNFGTFNQFEGLGGDDTTIGNGNTRLIYFNSTGTVTINMTAGTADGNASVGHDTFSGVNSVIGSNLADVYDATNFTGGAYGPSNSFEGAGGNDTITGNGNTQVTYFTATAGVTVNLQAGTADGNASVGHDTITGGVNGVLGSNFGDFLYGDAGANFLNGMNGDDLLDGRGGNGDFLYGGSGADTFVYATGYGATTIGDFSHGDGDKINLIGVAGVYSLADVLAAAQPLNGNTDTFIDFGKGDTLLLTGVSLSSLTAGDFQFALAPTITSVTDDVSPATGTLTSGGSTNDTDLTVQVSLTGTGAAAGDTVQLYDGSGTGSQLGISYTLLAVDISNGFANLQTGTLSDGTTYAITARFTDTLGNQSAVSTNTFTVTEDTTAPAATISGTIGTDTGATATIASGGLTRDNTLALSGTVSDADGVSSVQVYDGVNLLGTATVSSGTWSFTTAALSEGSHSFTATATDVAGNVTTTSAVTATVDTTAPAETISSTIGTDTGATTTITSGGLTRDNTLALSGTVSDANGVSSVQVYDGVSLLGTATVSSGTWSFTTAALSDGSHSFTATATDVAGNVTTTSAVTATVDTTAPAETISSTIGTNTGATTTIASGGLTRDATLALSGTVSDANGVSSVHVYDGVNLLGTATVSNGTWSFTTAALTDGSYSFTARATDTAGNVTTTSAVTATVDTTPPSESLSSTIGTDTGATATIASGGVTRDNTLALSGTVSDANLSSVHVFDGATDLGAATISGGNWSLTTGPLADGNHIFTAKATDTAGNSSTVGVITATVDTTAPAETISGTIGTDTGATTTITSGGLTRDNTLALSGTVSDANGVSSVQVYDGMNLLGTATVSSGTWSFTTAALSEGSHSFTAKATDNAGNVTTTSAVAATVDTTAPAVTITAAGGSINQAVQIITGTVGAADIGSTVTLFDNGGATPLGTAVVQNNGSWSASVTLLGNGTHSIVAKDTDAAGNTGTSSAVIYTLSTVGPTVTEGLAIDTGSSASDKITSNDALTGTGDANTLVTLTEGATVLGTTTSNGAGVWSFTPAGLSDGLHTIVASQTDGFGNTGAASLTFTIDTTTTAPSAPDLATASDSGTSSTDNITKNTTPVFTGSGAEVGATVTLFDTNGTTVLGTAIADASGNWSITSSTLASGNHTLTAKQTDIAGNTSVASAGLAVTIDTTAAAPSAPDLATASDSGTSSTDNITNVTTPVFTGSGAEVGATVTLFDSNGTTVLGSAIADASGNWSITSSALTSGSHTLTAKQTDIAGNTSAASAGLAVTIDTTAAAPSAPDLATASDSGTSSTDNITSNTTPVFTGSGAEVGATVTLFDSNGTTVLGSAIADASGNWSITSSALTSGSHTLTAKQTDIAGNTSVASAGLAVTIDTTAAAPSAPDLATASDSGTSSTDNITSNTTPVFTGSGAEVGATVTLFDTNGTTVLGTAIADASGNWSITSSALTSGNHTLTAKQTDIAGNASVASAGLAVTIDTTAVAPSAPDMTAATDTGTSNTDNITSNTTPVFTGSGAEVGATVTLFDSNGTTVLGTAIADASGNWSITSSALTSGSHTLTAKQTDIAGNPSVASAGLGVTIDTTAAAPSAPDMTAATDTGSSSTDNITSNTTPVFTGSGAEVGATVTLFDTNGTTVLGTAIADASGNWSITSSALTSGNHTLTAKQTDIAGNTSAASAGLGVTIDTTAAAPSAPDMTAATDTGTSSTDNITNVTTPVFTGSGAEVGATVTLFDTNGTTVLGSAIADASGNWSITSSALTSGNHTLTAKQTDIAGNPSVASAGLGVTIDTTAAAPSAPDLTAATDTGTSNTDNITSNTTPVFTGSGAEVGATVTLFDTNGTTVLGTAIADASGNWSITSSALTSGNHTLTAKQTDIAGNTSVASAGLTVTIDTSAPTESLAITSVSGSSSPTDKTITVSGSNSPLAAGDKIQISTDGSTWTDVVQNTLRSWSFADSVTHTGTFTYRTRVVDTAANVGATAIQAILVAYNGGTVTVGASSALVAEFTGTGGNLQLTPSAAITGTVNAISVASGPVAITGSDSVTTTAGDAIDLTATGAPLANPANLNVNLTGPITGAASGIAVTQNAYGSITVTTSGPVIGQAGRGILALQSATGVGSILVNGSGNVTGTGTGFSGIVAQSLNAADSSGVTVTQSGNVIGGRDGIRAQTNGNGNVTVTTGAGATITGTSLYGIEAASNGQGSISVTTAAGGTVNSGSAGINVYNQATSIPQVGGVTVSSIAVTANGTINSGMTYTGGGGRPAGILAGYKGGTTNTTNATAFGTVTVDNFANINAAGGDGIRAYNFGPGDVTVNDHAGTIVAKDMFGITASTNSTGKLSITMAAGDNVTSGSSGVQAVNLATAISTATTVSVTANGTIHSGTHLTPSGSQPQGVSAGYFPGNAGASNTNVNGTVLLDNFANVTAYAGWGLDAYNYGNGSVTLTDEANTVVSGAQFGIAAYSNSSGALSSGSVTINVGTNATITAGALYGLAGITGNINNSGNVSITTSAGDIITSGGTGIQSNSTATSAASSQISVTTLGGTIKSGYNFFQGGGTPSGISAGYGTNGALSTTLHGNVILDNSATINAVSGAGINLYNNGVGSISATLRAGSINAAQGGVNAFSSGGGNITIDTRGTINAGTIGINAGNGTSNPSSVNGLISILNSGTVNAPGAPYMPVVNVNNSNSSQTATLSNSPGGNIAASLFGRTTNNVAVSVFSGNGAITNSGTITGNVALFANGNFTNAIGGVWNLNGNNSFGTGATAISNAGMMNVSGWTFLSANGGPIALSNTNAITVAPNSVAQIFANVSGVGTISLGDRSALEISGSVAASQGFNILGRGLLTFDNPASVGSNLPLNFSSSGIGNLGSIISLIGGGISAANIAGSTLTVTGAFQSYSFQLSGSGVSGNYFDVLTPNQIVLVPTTATVISNVTTSQSPVTPVNFYILDNDHIGGSGPGFNLQTNDPVATNLYAIVVNGNSDISVNGSNISGLRVATPGASGTIINAANVTTTGAGPTSGIVIDTTLSGNSFNGSADIVNYGNVSGVTNAIVANTVNGNANIVSGFVTLTGTNSYGISGRSNGNGGVNIMTSGGTINAGLIGIVAFELQMPTASAGGNVTVHNSANITSGTNTANLANSGAAGIRAGILNNNTSVPNAAITGDVTIENRANITAQAGAGLFAFNYGSGNTSVTFAPGQYSITAINGGATGTGTGLTQYGIFAFNYGTGSSLVNAGWGTTITSGGTGINAGNQATAIASGSGSTVSIYSQGFISSGTNVNNSGSAQSAIQAGYNPGGNGQFSSAVYGDVIVNVASDGNPFGNPNPTLLAAAGPGILAYDYGVGNIAVSVGFGVSIQALTAATASGGGNAPYGISATNRGPGNIVVTTSGGSSINSGSSGINAVNDANPTAGSDLANLFAANVIAGKPAVIAVTTAGTINSGGQLTNSSNPSSGIAAGFFGSSGHANQYVSGNVYINNAAVITAAGYGLQGYNFGYGSITVNDAAGANITAGLNGIYAHADGGFTDPITGSALARDIAVNVYQNATIVAGTASSTAYGILALSTNAGSISVITAAGATIDSHLGGSGINAANEAASIDASFNSSVVVTNAATIHSGAGLTGFGNQPAGILAGYVGAATNPAPGNLANYNVIGEVVVNNFGNITADAGYGISAYSYGVGNVTANDFGGHITALGGASPPNGSGIGILAQNYGPGNVRVTTSAGTIITSGGSGIAAVNKATSVDPANSPVVVPSMSEVSVLALGTIHSGTIPTATVASDPAAGILAGYNPNNTNTPNNDVHGNVSIDDYATILAPAGTDGIRGVNYGTGDITIVVEAGAGVTGGRYGVAALGYDGGDVSITNSGTITATTDAVIAMTTSTGTAVIDNFGHLVGNAAGYNATFTNEIGSDWSLNGGASVFTGVSTLANAGLIDSNGVSAISGLSNLTNTGTIEVQSGTLTLGGPVTGAGTIVVYAATMEFGGASDANVQFTSTATGTLKLDDASHFTGTVTGFAFGDTIDLAGIAPANVSVINSGHLQVSYGTGSFELVGNYDPTGFTITSDGSTGTNITWNHQAPVILTNNLTTVQNGDGSTTVLGVQVTDADPAASSETFNLTATTGAAASGTTITPSSDSGSLTHINSTFTTGVTYNPGGSAPAIDSVTLTVTDGFGATDTVNFVFNQGGSGSNVTLQGTSGKDVIFATQGQDVLSGGAGQDQFVFKPVLSGTVQHTITDFEAGIDTLDVRQFSNITGASIPSAVQQGNDTLITLDAHDTLLLKNVLASSVHTSDYIVHA
ncbi:hypothetical protein FFI89_032165 [Bradyrhizobium sp. KBS0727]|nr:hypothetical protein FFI89_032165 [Bradyrhizobium sp. KBS0727]